MMRVSSLVSVRDVCVTRDTEGTPLKQSTKGENVSFWKAGPRVQKVCTCVSYTQACMEMFTASHQSRPAASTFPHLLLPS